jgi:hypothetical protein
LQQSLLGQGRAWVSARVEDTSCVKILLTAEGVARASRRGFWADPNFAPLRADHPAELAIEQERFVLVEGGVMSMHESGGTIYLNFGPLDGRFPTACAAHLPSPGSSRTRFNAVIFAYAAGLSIAPPR